jgi:hypothetical protein
MNENNNLSVNKYRFCDYCGTPFYGMDKRQKYCADTCKVFMCQYRKNPAGRTEHRQLWTAN